LRAELDDLRTQRTSKIEDLDDALADLICLQAEYDMWVVPDNFSASPTQDKLYEVQCFRFKGLRDDIPNLTKFALEDDLESALEQDLEDTLSELFDDGECTLDEANEFVVPKGFGRD
jgi:hypothetical protein